ncbi:MAG TPA: chemotaxis protein CheW [Rhodobacteraceae bacterium]|nr:chemotaxis protein CheW [Paracoccaceae bacterium]
MTDTEETKPADEFELLTFQVGTQEYAIDIMSVREIRGWTKATPLPHAPPFVRGVINLRGTVLTIVDLADRLGMGPIQANERNVIIVVQTGKETVGLLVDAVSDILAVSKSDLQTPPEMSGDGEQNFISALMIADERMVRILALSAALPSESLEAA